MEISSNPNKRKRSSKNTELSAPRTRRKTRKLSRCRTCWQETYKRFPHPLKFMNRHGDALCESCLDMLETSCTECKICGEGDLGEFMCTHCTSSFCGGCIVGNFGDDVFQDNLWEYAKLGSWTCFMCSEDSGVLLILEVPDVDARIKYGEFSPRTFVSNRVRNSNSNLTETSSKSSVCSTRTLPTSRSASPTSHIVATSESAPLRKVISVCWFISEGDLIGKQINRLNAMKYFWGLLLNIEKVEKMFPEWAIRVYYDESVLRICPKVIPKVLEAMKNHPQVQLVKSPDWTEFKRNDTFLNLIATMFRFLILAEPGYDVVVIRDIDTVVSSGDIQKIEEMMKSENKLYHRYKCSEYGWELAAGSVAFQSQNRRAIFPKMEAWLLEFCRDHMRDPSKVGYQITQNEERFPLGNEHNMYNPELWDDESSTSELSYEASQTETEVSRPRPEPEANCIEPFRYLCDQAFLETYVWKNMAKRKVMTTYICYQRIHTKDELEESEIEHGEERTKTRSNKFCGVCQTSRNREAEVSQRYFLGSKLPDWTTERFDDWKLFEKKLTSRFGWLQKYMPHSNSTHLVNPVRNRKDSRTQKHQTPRRSPNCIRPTSGIHRQNGVTSAFHRPMGVRISQKNLQLTNVNVDLRCQVCSQSSSKEVSLPCGHIRYFRDKDSSGAFDKIGKKKSDEKK